MSEAQPKSEIDIQQKLLTNQNLIKAEWDGRQTDWLLQWFVKFSNDMSMEISIVLTIGGNLVAGTLIPHKTYFELLADDFSKPFEAFEGDTAKNAKDLILAYIPEPTPEGEVEPACQYIHLKNARVFTGGNGPIATTGVLWRGKIAAVEGFSFGSIS
jgi:hypothetical protein